VQIFAMNWISCASSSVDKSPMTIMQSTVLFILIKSCCTPLIYFYITIIYINNQLQRWMEKNVCSSPHLSERRHWVLIGHLLFREMMSGLPPIICKEHTLRFEKTLIMGILNVTPDSFSDGGQFHSVDGAVTQAKKMVADGADIIDIGGESSRPGSDPLSEKEELRRILPVVQQLVTEIPVPISIDTYKPHVADTCLNEGAHVINDITGLTNPEMRTIVAKHDVPVVLMHMLGTPKNMQQNPVYQGVLGEITSFFQHQMTIAKNAGIHQIIIDPGIGFGKTLQHNLEILRHLDVFTTLGCPVLVGPSRKSFIGTITGQPVDKRLEGTIAAVTIAVLNGANIVRVHDVKECVQALQVVDAIRGV
jgi:dihydropteroate synthase